MGCKIVAVSGWCIALFTVLACLLVSVRPAQVLIDYSSEIRIGSSSVRAAGSPLVGMQAVLFTLGTEQIPAELQLGPFNADCSELGLLSFLQGHAELCSPMFTTTPSLHNQLEVQVKLSGVKRDAQPLQIGLHTDPP